MEELGDACVCVCVCVFVCVCVCACICACVFLDASVNVRMHVLVTGACLCATPFVRNRGGERRNTTLSVDGAYRRRGRF